MSAFPRKEMEEMVARFNEAMRLAEETHDWTALGKFYTPDATYGWFFGHDEECMLMGRDQIEKFVMDVAMQGYDDWSFPYLRSIIDEDQAEVVGFSPYLPTKTRPDGTAYHVSGFTGSWFHYAGNFQWSWQRDFFDLGNLKATIKEMAKDGVLSEALTKRFARIAEDLKTNPDKRFDEFGHYRRGQSPMELWDMAPLPVSA